MGVIRNTRTLNTYSTLAAAVAAIAANDLLEITGTWPSPDTTPVNVNQNVNINVLGASRHPGWYSGAGHYRLEIASGDCIVFADEGRDIDFLSVKMVSGSPNTAGIRIAQIFGTVQLTNCILKGPGSSESSPTEQFGVNHTAYSDIINLENTQISEFSTAACAERQSTATTTWNINSCSLINNGGRGSGGGIGVENTGNFSGVTFNVFNSIVAGARQITGNGDFYDQSTTGAPTFNIRQCIDSDGSSSIDASAQMIATNATVADLDQGAGNFVIVNETDLATVDLRLQSLPAENNLAIGAHAITASLGLSMPAVDASGDSRVSPYSVGADYEIILINNFSRENVIFDTIHDVPFDTIS